GEKPFSDLMTRGCSVQGPTVMCRIEALRAMGGYDEAIRIEDYTLALRMTHEKRRVIVLGELVTQYRVHGGSWTARPIKRELKEIGDRFRHTPEYAAFYRLHFGQDFWHLVKEGRKRSALQLLRTEPVPWTGLNVRGLLRMLIPYAMVRIYRVLKSQVTRTAT